MAAAVCLSVVHSASLCANKAARPLQPLQQTPSPLPHGNCNSADGCVPKDSTCKLNCRLEFVLMFSITPTRLCRVVTYNFLFAIDKKYDNYAFGSSLVLLWDGPTCTHLEIQWPCRRIQWFCVVMEHLCAPGGCLKKRRKLATQTLKWTEIILLYYLFEFCESMRSIIPLACILF